MIAALRSHGSLQEERQREDYFKVNFYKKRWTEHFALNIKTPFGNEADIFQRMTNLTSPAARRHSLPPLTNHRTTPAASLIGRKAKQKRQQLPASVKMGSKASVHQGRKSKVYVPVVQKLDKSVSENTAKVDAAVVPAPLPGDEFLEPKESISCEDTNRESNGDKNRSATKIHTCKLTPNELNVSRVCQRSKFLHQGGDVLIPATGVNLVMTGNKATQSPHRTGNISQSMRYSRSCSSLPTRKKSNSMVSMEERLVTEAKQRRAASSGAAKKRNYQKKPGSKKNVCILSCIKPNNVLEEKEKFFNSGFEYNPQFSYDYHLAPSVRERFSKASSSYLAQALAIMNRVLKRYGSYEAFERTTGGDLLSRTQLWNTVKRYLEREGFAGEVVVNISDDLLSRGSMTINGGRPTLSIRESSAKKLWVEGLLRHEIGTHHLRFHNNRQQIWHSAKVRRQLGLKPANPTEEGLASLHSVLLRKDPSLWRSATLYYTVYKASQLSFCELFEDLAQFVDNSEVRWDYCLRAKRGQTDTSLPGCFCKDQVYLTGLLPLLERRHTLDFHLLCTMGKVSHEDLEMLKPYHNSEKTKVPTFMTDLNEYRRKLDHIVAVNGLEEFLSPLVAKKTPNLDS